MLYIHFVEQIGEVVPAREGLRPYHGLSPLTSFEIGEVVPAREGLRLRELSPNKHYQCDRRSGSSKRRIKTDPQRRYDLSHTHRRSGSSKRRIKTIG